MSKPRDLWENTRLAHKAYPIQIFHNETMQRQVGDSLLYLHWHEHMELIIQREGHAVYYIDSRPYELSPSEVLLVPGGSLHVGYVKAAGDFKFDCIVFNASLFNEWMYDPAHIQLIAPFLEGKWHFPVALSQEGLLDTTQRQLIESLINEWREKETGYQLLVKASLYSFLVQLARKQSNTHTLTSSSPPYFANRERFKLLIDWIEGNYADKLTLTAAAEIVRLDASHFCKQFKKLTGRTFVEYVNVCRVNAAEQLLRSGHETITEIALRVGCENPNYFTKLYKQYKGLTPSEARRSFAASVGVNGS